MTKTTAKRGVGKSTKTPAKKSTKKPAKKSPENSTARAPAKTFDRSRMAAKPTTIDEYLSHVDADTRRMLEALRACIKRLEPEVEECISYSMPAFRYRGKVIAGFAATTNGGSYYPFSGRTLGTLAAPLKGMSQTKSGLHFTKQEPLSEELVRLLLEARKAEL